VSSGSFGVQKKAKIVRALDETSARTKTEAKENALSTDGDFLSSRGNSQRLFEAETATTKRSDSAVSPKGDFSPRSSNSIACFGAEISEISVEACERSIRESIGRDFRISLIVFGAFRAAIETEADVDGSRRPARSPRSTVTPTSVGASKATPKALRTSREYRLRGPPRRV
jgi:hypothetical protein